MSGQDLFKQERETWLENARGAARQLLRTQERITIEDVLKVCPRPKYLHCNITGSVFKDGTFIHVGFTKAKKQSSNGRVIGQWQDKHSLYGIE